MGRGLFGLVRRGGAIVSKSERRLIEGGMLTVSARMMRLALRASFAHGARTIRSGTSWRCNREQIRTQTNRVGDADGFGAHDAPGAESIVRAWGADYSVWYVVEVQS